MFNIQKNYVFHWEGISADGIRCSGKYSNICKKAVENDLLKQQITPLRIKVNNQFQLGYIKRKVSAKQISEFTSQLALLLKSGFSLQKSLLIIRKGHNCINLQNLISSIHASIESGESLTKTLQQFPNEFDEIYCGLIQVGENTGVLAKAFVDLSNHLDRLSKLKTKIHKAMFYPFTVLCTATIITLGLLIYVIPEFKSIFNGFGAKLPWLTRAVISISNQLKNSLLFIVGIAAFVFISLRFALRRTKLRQSYHRALLKLPIIKQFIITTTIARWARILAMTRSTGIPLVDSLQHALTSINNLAIKEMMATLHYQVEQGQSLADASKNKPYLPKQAWAMMAIGEDSGTLDTILEQVADIYTLYADNLLDSLSKLLEPVIMLILAILMGGLIISMYLPIFKLGSAL